MTDCKFVTVHDDEFIMFTMTILQTTQCKKVLIVIETCLPGGVQSIPLLCGSKNDTTIFEAFFRVLFAVQFHCTSQGKSEGFLSQSRWFFHKVVEISFTSMYAYIFPEKLFY